MIIMIIIYIYMLYTHLSLSLSLIWYSIFLWRLSILRQMTILRGNIVAMPGIAAPPSASWVSCKVLLRRSRSERRWGDQDKWRIMENQKWVNPFCCIYNVLLLYIPYIYIHSKMAVTEDTRSISSGPKNGGSANFTSVFLIQSEIHRFQQQKTCSTCFTS